MRIGFDAKRAFHNATGLGNYSRALMHDLAFFYPENTYVAFNPKVSDRFTKAHEDLIEILPKGFLNSRFHAYWRSFGMIKDLKKTKLDLFHGLSHELPWGIEKTGIKSIVSIHDLIVWRYPEHYSKFDVWMHRKKIRHACNVANHIIAISEQTKNDLISYLKIPNEKISVCYQPCHPRFETLLNEDEIKSVKTQLNLPEQYFLYVGSITERKNLLNIIRALDLERANINIPLVVIGQGKAYKKTVQAYILEKNLQDRILFLSDSPNAQCNDFRNGNWFPAIYQGATALIYPSLFEGFGIPILEALWSGLPVVTSDVSSLPEVGGPSSLYVNPLNPDSIGEAMIRVLKEDGLAKKMKQEGLAWAKKFSRSSCTQNIHELYVECMKKPA